MGFRFWFNGMRRLPMMEEYQASRNLMTVQRRAEASRSRSRFGGLGARNTGGVATDADLERLDMLERQAMSGNIGSVGVINSIGSRIGPSFLRGHSYNIGAEIQRGGLRRDTTPGMASRASFTGTGGDMFRFSSNAGGLAYEWQNLTGSTRANVRRQAAATARRDTADESRAKFSINGWGFPIRRGADYDVKQGAGTAMLTVNPYSNTARSIYRNRMRDRERESNRYENRK